jgi:hypothetical protein
MFSNKVVLLAFLGIVVGAARAHATPAFARKYRTSCVTCHTIFPKLTPFGEAFRRNGFRFPGVDGDATKAEPVPLGTDAQKKLFPDAVWPAQVSPFPAFALGFNGSAVIHPDTTSSAGQADHGTVFATNDLLAEAHLWAMGTYDDSIAYYAEATFSGGGVSLERGAIYFNDLIGPKHAVNLIVGKGPSTLTSFGPHSSYIADTSITQISVAGLYGSATQFLFTDNHTGLEANGVLGGRFNYAAGVVAGETITLRNTANIYAHAGYKLGGMSLDGEDAGASPQDIEHEKSITIDAFFYRSISTYDDPLMPGTTTKNTSLAIGGAVRGQYGKLELNAGAYFQTDDQAYTGAPTIKALAQWDEASYLLYPWLALAARVDFLQISPDGGASVNDFKLTPGVAALVRPNLRFTLTMPIERASGAPATDWTAAGNFAAPAMPTAPVGPEVEAILITMFTAF